MGIFFFNFSGINHLISASVQNNAGKKVFVNCSLCSTKTYLQGQGKRLKKIFTPRYASGSIFLVALVSTAITFCCCALAHSVMLRLVLTPGVVACFVLHGIPHSRLLLPP
jgi:hypothetical protein